MTGAGDFNNPFAYLEFTTPPSHKFWEARVFAYPAGNAVLRTRWGPIGSMGQEKREAFDTVDAAKRSMGRQVLKKIDKGYRFVRGAHVDRIKATGDAIEALRRGAE